MSPHAARQAPPSTYKGRATREKIVVAAAELMHRHGANHTTTKLVCEAIGVSPSQIYHYFADKHDLTRAVIAYQAKTTLNQQASLLTELDSFDDLAWWRDVMVGVAEQRDGAGGHPLASLSSELSEDNPWARDALSDTFTAWTATIRASLTTLIDKGILRPDTDTNGLALTLLAALNGGFLLAQAQRSTDALRAALDAVIAHIRQHATQRADDSPRGDPDA